MSSRKGNSFERDLCTRLSEWASLGVYDDVFWRTAGSGGRATTRTKSNRRTRGQYGDIGATNPHYAHFTEQVVWELKRGYPAADIHRLVEVTSRNVMENNDLYRFLIKTMKTAVEAEARWWVVVTRRNQARSLFWLPSALLQTIEDIAGGLTLNAPTCRIVIPQRNAAGVMLDTTAISEDDFFEIHPKTFEAAIE